VYYFFLGVVVVGYKTTATARWALLLIVRAFFNDTITVAVWTGFHVCVCASALIRHDLGRRGVSAMFIKGLPRDTQRQPN